MARRWLEPPLRLARRLLNRVVLAGLAPGLAAITVLPFAFGLPGLGLLVVLFPFVIAQAPLIACLDYGADEKSALPGRIAKPMLRWSVVAGLAPLLLVLFNWYAGSRPNENGIQKLSSIFLL
ncbi:MAG: hypothetical protein HQL39_17215, partial [Alphaproteobacteria bacterium]|nr:hypothetical protein [Alphaproteobacteria bacterium]